MENGAERLRGQFRDAAQQGQTDDHGGDRLEDSMANGMRRAERGVEKLLKNRKMGNGNRTYPDDPHVSSEGPSPTAESPEAAPAPDRLRGPQIKTREAAAQGERPGAPSSDRAAQTTPDGTAIKTKDRYIQRQTSTIPESPPQASTQGRQNFAREQGRRSAARRSEQFRRGSTVGGGQAGRSSYMPPRTTSNLGKTVVQPVQKSPSDGRMLIKAARPGGRSMGRTARNTVKTVEHASRQAIKTAQRTAKGTEQTVRAARKTVQAAAKAPQRAVQTARGAARTTVTTVKTAARAAVSAVKTAIAAAQALAGAIAAGGWVVIVIVVVLCLAGLLIASPFGIFLADGGNAPDAVSPPAAVARINSELTDRLNDLQTGGTYDNVEIQGQPPDWAEVLAVFAARTAGAEDGVDVAVLDPDRVERLRTVFWDMTKLTTEVQTTEHPASGDTPAWTETTLRVTITPRTPDDMRVFYQFTDHQNQALDELLANRAMLTALAGNLSVTSQDAKALLAALPEDLSPARRAVVETACRLVGKLNYFWGGKSLVIGWDFRWGTLKQVTAAGSSTTGTYRPYGLDCSGYADWVFYNASGGNYVLGHGGGTHMQHTYCTDITWEEALPGDLVFYPEDEHVGIVGGRGESGDLLIIHCASSSNNVVITGADGFTSVARPLYYGE